jgi:hypothetical protein
MADVNTNNNDQNNQQNGDDQQNQQPKAPTIEELMVQLAQERAEKERFKASIDKLTASNGDLTKKLRAKQTAEEQAEDAKREQEAQRAAHVKELEDKLNLIETTQRYQTMGMDANLAEATAKAELAGDKDLVAKNIAAMTDAKIKAAEAEWLKSRPDPQGCTGEKDKDDEESAFWAAFNS